MATMTSHDSNHYPDHQTPENDSQETLDYQHSTNDNRTRPFSIDLSLELERQLNMDSAPPTPAHDAATFQHDGDNHQSNRDSLDPQILAHIIMQLRHSLVDVTKERDQFREKSQEVDSEGLKEALKEATERATGMEEELNEAKQKIRDDEDAIAMLRSKVEESRRGLMRLQTESRRQSVAVPSTLDLSRVGLTGFSPPSAKRASFTPLTGSGSAFAARPVVGHRRISSVSDSGSPISSPDLQAHGFVMLDTPTFAGVHQANNRRFSGLLGRTSPPQEPDPLVAEVQSLRKELAKAKEDIEELRNELVEMTEAKDASETCVKALREYIAENNVGVVEIGKGQMPPPPPVPMAEAKSTPAATGWGFKLWKSEALARSPETPSGPKRDSVASPSPQPSVLNGAPLSRKLGGFFSSRASISSASSISTPPPPLHLIGSNEMEDIHRASVHSVSDSSSVAEPLSPTSELSTNFMIRDVTNGSDTEPIPKSWKEMQAEAESKPNTYITPI